VKNASQQRRTVPRFCEACLGQYTDAETGFTYLRARHHDPTTAQLSPAIRRRLLPDTLDEHRFGRRYLLDVRR